MAEIINTSDLDKQLVVIDDIVLQQKHLQCLTMTDVGEDEKWLGDEVRYLPKLVYQFSFAQYNELEFFLNATINMNFVLVG